MSEEGGHRPGEGGAHRPAVTRDQLWKALLDKAGHPVGYVPAITECRIVERRADRFLREARRGEWTIRQWVTFDEARGRITFRHADSTDLAEMRNEIGEDEHGRLTLTLSLTLTEAASAAVFSRDRRLAELDADFSGTLEAMTVVLREAAIGHFPAGGGTESPVESGPGRSAENESVYSPELRAS
ncbi:AtaL-like protein [Streptomyces sp. URMC 123]|uniref:AtaL-like protein n=1 Tax=Streptomyces sp. URMC 123 TaxID=3423403 RepID=UPI003F1A26AA